MACNFNRHFFPYKYYELRYFPLFKVCLKREPNLDTQRNKVRRGFEHTHKT